MPIRIKWNEYETALLIEGFMKIESSPELKSKIISELSNNLRMMAINSGLEIDDVYRNVNGISMQLGSIAHIFYPERPYLTGSAMFKNMVNKYLNDKNGFNDILKEAKTRIGIESNMNEENSNSINDFKEWVFKNCGDVYCDSIIRCMNEISDFCIKHGICKKNLWEITDRVNFVNKTNQMLNMKLFRKYHKNNSKIVDKTVKAYKQYLCDIEINNATSDINGDFVEDRIVESETVYGDKDGFFQWLLDVKGLAKPTCLSYVSAVNVSEEFACNNISEECKLFETSKEIIHNTIIKLLANHDYIILNKEQHNRFVASLKKYTEYVDISESLSKVDKDEEIDIYSKIKKLCKDNSPITNVLSEKYEYGFNVNSPIELMRFKRFYSDTYGKDVGVTDDVLLDNIKECGFEYSGKLYILDEEKIKHIIEIIEMDVNTGINIIYYDNMYSQYEAELYDSKIISSEMLKELLQLLYPRFQYKKRFFILDSASDTEHNLLVKEIDRIWGDTILLTVEEMDSRLYYVPLDKIKYALSSSDKFIWNSFETYSRFDAFIISDDTKQIITETVEERCDSDGGVSFDDLPLSVVFEDNYELSETAVYEIIIRLLGEGFSRNNKMITRKEDRADVTSSIVQYCYGKDKCSFNELEELMLEKAGQIRYPTIVEAANSVMIRTDYNTFVSDDGVIFETEKIDSLLEQMIIGKGVGIKEILSFATFPYCGVAWNLFVLESYCRRFSKKFRYICITPNSQNAGAIVKKNYSSDIYDVMVDRVANSEVKLSENEVYDYLITAGFLIKRQYSNIEKLLKDASEMRERSN